MAANRRVAEQHEDWLNLADAEPPWFSLPVLKRAFPNGLDATPPEIRAEHKARWNSDGTTAAARTTTSRMGYLDWLLRDVLGWGADYVTGPDLPTEFEAGVTRHDVTVIPSGIYRPESTAPVGLFDDSGVGIDDEQSRVRVLIFCLPPGTDPGGRPTEDTWPATWVQRAALSCRHHKVSLALVTDGDHLALVHAPTDGATGWGSWRAAEFATEPVLLDSFRSMLRSHRFLGVTDKDTTEALLIESAGTQAEVTDQLGSQVRKATELLVNAISRANRDRGGSLLEGVSPHEVYEAAVTAMMRLVFLLVAEENDLLPIDNPHYQELFAVRTLRESLQEERFGNPEILETRTAAWHRLLATSRAVHSGVHHDELSVPAYGGDLFDPDRFPFLEGRTPGGTWRITTGTPIPVTDLDVLAILDALLVLRFAGPGGVIDTRRLSYRHVEVEQIGHIYERLLDHDTVQASEVVIGLKGRSGEEPEMALSTLEAKHLVGESALVAALTDKDGKNGGRYVGTPKQVTTLLGATVDGHLRAGLIQACQGDEALAKRLEPFARLLRLDLRGRPMVFLPGAVYVTETGSRRDSGTAYTTKELADEVAEHALAPLAYAPGPQDTADTNEWEIRSSAEILGLKICDPAVGSGAILVASCRYLANCLIEAWRAEGDPRAAETATASDDPNRLDVVVAARRLVAEHCCYGVDRNPMAVEMAKLSMWLTTLAKDRPFTFLDHALKSGDSLLGIWEFDQLRYLHYDVPAGRDRTVPIADWEKGGESLFVVERLLAEALELRREVQGIDTRSSADVERKEKAHAEAEARLGMLAAIADVVAGAAISTAGDRDPVTALTRSVDDEAEIIVQFVSALGTPRQSELLATLREQARRHLDAGRPPGALSRQPFHWPLAFPEVYSRDRPGFDSIIGNPPFLGDAKLSRVVGDDYRAFLVAWIARTRGRCDLVGYFMIAAWLRTRHEGTTGFLSTSAAASGDTREVALARASLFGMKLYRARTPRDWPGDASLQFICVFSRRGAWQSESFIDDDRVVGISSYLSATLEAGGQRTTPQRLRAEGKKSFKGSDLGGNGFVLEEDEAMAVLDLGRNIEVVKPYINGEEFNTSPTQAPGRWVIDFRDLSLEEVRSLYPELLDLVEERVRPYRETVKAANMRRYWWRHNRTRPELYRSISRLERAIGLAVTSNTLAPAFLPVNAVYATGLIVFAYDDSFHLGLLQSGFHSRWAIQYSSRMRTDVRYTPSDVFETFPQPPVNSEVARLGGDLNDYRSRLMINRQLGLTRIYNQIHDPSVRDDREIMRLRELHAELDFVVCGAYGWSDVDPDHGFHEVRGQGVRFTFAPEAAEEVLDRLLELNKERHQAEVAAGLHTSSKARTKPRKTASNQRSFLEEE